MFKNVKDCHEFRLRVDILWEPDYEDLELEEFPTTGSGGFEESRLEAFLRLAKLHPEFHIVSCIDPDLYVNTFVWGALTYHLAQGDADPKLIHDLYDKLDIHLLQTLNSTRNKRSA